VRFASLLTFAVWIAAMFSMALPLTWGGERIVQLQVGGPCPSSQTVSPDNFDHSRFDQLLRKHVNCHGEVCYSEWAANPQDVQQLTQYLHDLGHADISSPAAREARLALGINAYNALAIFGILQEYPVISIQLLNKKDATYKIFDDLKVWLGGEYLSLNQIENAQLRPMGDPRIHFALVCAARGCPKLRNEAYTPERVDPQLTENAYDFFANRGRFRISHTKGKVLISPILKWYGEDFGANPNELISTVFAWLPAQDQQWLATNPGWRLDYLGYDWGLNDQCPSPTVAVGRIPFDLAEHWEPIVRPLLPPKK